MDENFLFFSSVEKTKLVSLMSKKRTSLYKNSPGKILADVTGIIIIRQKIVTGS